MGKLTRITNYKREKFRLNLSKFANCETKDTSCQHTPFNNRCTQSPRCLSVTSNRAQKADKSTQTVLKLKEGKIFPVIKSWIQRLCSHTSSTLINAPAKFCRPSQHVLQLHITLRNKARL